MKMIPVNKVNLFQDQDCLLSADAYPPKADLPSDPSIRRILIIKWGGMGDVVISTAIMQDICNAFPHAEIHLNAMPPWQSLFEHDPRFKKVWTVDLRKQERGILGMLRWLSIVRKNQYDLIVDLQTNDRSRLLLTLLKWMGAAPQYLLGNRPLYPYYLRRYLEDQVNIHAFVMMRRMLTAVGIPANTAHPVIYSDPESTREAQSLLEAHALQAKRFAVFLCGSHAAGLTKRWGIENYAQLSQLLLEKGVQKIVLVGGNDELKECESIAAKHPDIIVNLCGKTTLLQLPTLFKAAKWIIANDTGTAHLASASETPMLVICGPTNPLRVKPIGQHVIAIQAEIECKNCYQKTCGHHSCMRGLTPDKLLPYVDLLK
ncbi:MAG: glycosyltransferase family 9 protein [Methylophilus sp.]|nr:glycosyltransferase family 9 protein [Methylophilus sp.]